MLWAIKGQRITRLNLERDKPDRDTLLALLLGPTDNLRAPTMLVGSTLIVGFHPDVFREVLLDR